MYQLKHFSEKGRNKPTIIIAHYKILVVQFYSEFKDFFQ